MFMMLAEDNPFVFACCWLPAIIVIIVLILSLVGGIFVNSEQSRIEKEIKLKSEENAKEIEREAKPQAEKHQLEAKKQRELFEQASDEYFNSLEKLKSDPNNADLRQYTLALGRKYSELSRRLNTGTGSITVYDEVALLNDINAACANAKSTVASRETDNLNIEERLARLSELKGKNLISEEEYETRRQKILDEI